nr:putative 4-amino-4-deoxy-L-arabinose-phosphoundecaprenol flippase subunit [Vibrio mimicus]
MGYLYIFGCIAFTVYGQLILKWRINSHSQIPGDLIGKAIYLVKVIFTDPFVFSGFGSAFIASIFWMAAMTKFNISYAYPFMSLAFILVLVGSFVFFGEPLSLNKILGTIMVIFGLIVLSKG